VGQSRSEYGHKSNASAAAGERLEIHEDKLTISSQRDYTRPELGIVQVRLIGGVQ